MVRRVHSHTGLLVVEAGQGEDTSSLTLLHLTY